MRRVFHLHLFLCLTFLFGVFAQAETPFEYRLRNFRMKDQLENNTKRTLPQGEDFSFASDVLLWKYWPDTSSYYHGPGFWVDTFVEYRPLKNLDINAKVLVANGSSSFGYSAASGIKPFIGVSWDPDVLPGDWRTLIRFFDLDRTTIAGGLFFQDREMSGAYVSINNDFWFFDIRLPGTSVLNLSGDLYSTEIFHRSSVNDFGVHTFFISKLAALLPSQANPNVLEVNFFNLDPVTSLFLRSRETSWVQYRFEAAFQGDQTAYIAGLGMQQRMSCKFCYDTFIQYRHYDEDILSGLGGATSFEFIPYSLQIRDYNNAINILRVRGEAKSYSYNLNFKYNFSDRFAFESINEIGRIEYNTQSESDDYYWYKQSFNYCPNLGGSQSCFKFFAANKILRVNGLERSFFDNSNIHKRSDVFGVEAIIYL